MITTTREWLRRNRTKFAVGFGVVGVGYLAGQYVLSKISDARERSTSDRIAKENLQRRFRQNQEDCTITILELLPAVTEKVVEALPAERISKEIQQKNAERAGKTVNPSEIAPSDASSGSPSVVDEDGRSSFSLQSDGYVHASQMAASETSSIEKPAKSKAQLWNELKILSISRAFTLTYTLALLSLLTRIQLNLLGRKNYLASVVTLASYAPHDPTINLENHEDSNNERAYGNDFEVNREYLTFSWWIMHRGWKDLLAKVEAAVREVFGPIKPSEEIGVERLSSLILDVRRRVEGYTSDERRARKWLTYLLPPQEEEDFVLRESGVATPPSPVASPAPQDPANLSSPPASPPPPPSATSIPQLRHLLDETADLIDSPLFAHVLTLLLDASFSLLTDQKIRSEAFRNRMTSSTASDSASNVNADSTITSSTKLAAIMAVMTREAHNIGRGVPNDYVQVMDSVGELEGFAAVMYGGNLDTEFDATFSLSANDTSNERTRSHSQQRSLEDMMDSVAEEPPLSEQTTTGVVNAASGYMNMAWSGFESVWGTVTRGSDDRSTTR